MMIAEMLKKENVQITESVQDWKEAINLSLAPLIKGGYVKQCYADNIIKSTEEMGPYYVLTEDIALIHGRPEEGVIEKQLAITLLREPVVFAEDSYPVRLLVALAANDSNSHIDAMRVLASIFMDEDKIQEIVESETPEQVYDFLLKSEAEAI